MANSEGYSPYVTAGIVALVSLYCWILVKGWRARSLFVKLRKLNMVGVVPNLERKLSNIL